MHCGIRVLETGSSFVLIIIAVEKRGSEFSKDSAQCVSADGGQPCGESPYT